MTKKKSGEAKDDAKDGKWSTGAKVGAAAVGSAALVAALLYANKKRKNATPAPKTPPRKGTKK